MAQFPQNHTHGASASQQNHLVLGALQDFRGGRAPQAELLLLDFEASRGDRVDTARSAQGAPNGVSSIRFWRYVWSHCVLPHWGFPNGSGSYQKKKLAFGARRKGNVNWNGASCFGPRIKEISWDGFSRVLPFLIPCLSHQQEEPQIEMLQGKMNMDFSSPRLEIPPDLCTSTLGDGILAVQHSRQSLPVAARTQPPLSGSLCQQCSIPPPKETRRSKRSHVESQAAVVLFSRYCWFLG